MRSTRIIVVSRVHIKLSLLKGMVMGVIRDGFIADSSRIVQQWLEKENGNPIRPLRKRCGAGL
jgi:hypothetical protein